MNRGTSIVSIDGSAEESAPAQASNAAPEWAPPEPEELLLEEEFAAAPGSRGIVAAGVIAIALALGWTAFFGWTHRTDLLGGAEPAAWINLVRDWTIPLIAIGIGWLLLMRNSTREATRFGGAARLLGDEAVMLESRLLTVNRELSLAREFLAAQARDLDSLGRMAGERISEHADRLAGLLGENASKIDLIATVSETALDNMEKLRGQLPVIANSAKDVTNNIGAAGRTAHVQIEEMISGFRRINEFGHASETQVASLRTAIDAALGEFSRRTEELEGIANTRFATLTERSEEFRTRLDAHEIDALAAIRNRARTLGEELEQTRGLLDTSEAESLVSLRARLAAVRDESGTVVRSLRDGEASALEAWRSAIATLETELGEAIAKVSEIDENAMQSARNRLSQLVTEATEVDARLAERDRAFAEEMARRRDEIDSRQTEFQALLVSQMAELDAAIAERRAAQEEQSLRLVTHSETVATQLDQFSVRMAEVAVHGGEAETAVAANLALLGEKLSASREALSDTDRIVTGLTDSSVRLLELIQAGVKHASDDLPKAMAQGEASLSGLEARIASLNEAASGAERSGEGLADHVRQSGEALATTLGELDRMHGTIGTKAAEHAALLGELRETLAGIDTSSTVLADRAQSELRSAIDALSGSAQEAIENLGTMSTASLQALAARIGEESGAAIETAMRTRVGEVAGQIEEAAAKAAGVGRDAAIQLRDQLTKVNELTVNLERRVSQAREKAEEQVDNDFARRVALITEALNSNAIDIASALDTEVTDTAWSAYLKGDRGIFTRRAVKLLEPSEAKAVTQIYENDTVFRDHVSRYIHDFEGMLRQLLSTRDGHALGVTLLSSDMGKLYVALAQAIARLRS